MKMMFRGDEKILKSEKPNEKAFYFDCWVTIGIIGLVAIIGIILSLVMRQYAMSIWIFIACAVMAFLVWVIYTAIYINIEYCITEKQVIIRYGLIRYSYRSIDINDISTMQISVSIIDRIFGDRTGSIMLGDKASNAFSQLGFLPIFNRMICVDNPDELCAIIKQQKETLKGAIKKIDEEK